MDVFKSSRLLTRLAPGEINEKYTAIDELPSLIDRSEHSDELSDDSLERAVSASPEHILWRRL